MPVLNFVLVVAVAEENLVAPERPDLVSSIVNQNPEKFLMLHELISGILNHEQGRFDHPYVSFLFYGTDAAGDFIPIKQLREQYNRPRHEISSDSQGEDS